jgi:hypothetical protein
MNTSGNSSITVTKESEGHRVEASYKLDYGGQVSISIVVPLVNPTLLEAQAIACEQAADGLRKYAERFRQIIAQQNGANE